MVSALIGLSGSKASVVPQTTSRQETWKQDLSWLKYSLETKLQVRMSGGGCRRAGQLRKTTAMMIGRIEPSCVLNKSNKVFVEKVEFKGYVILYEVLASYKSIAL